jgi:hypothetical protein
MSATATTEEAILDLFCDEDEEFDMGEALTALASVIAAICCETSDPFEQSALFVAALDRRIAAEVRAERGMLS